MFHLDRPGRRSHPVRPGIGVVRGRARTVQDGGCYLVRLGQVPRADLRNDVMVGAHVYDEQVQFPIGRAQPRSAGPAPARRAS